MYLKIVILVTFPLVCFTQDDTPLSKPMAIDYQAEFAWDLYKKLQLGFTQNLAIAPYSLRKIFVCLQQLTVSTNPASAALSEQLKMYLRFNPKGKLPDLVRRRYSSQRAMLERENSFNTTTLAAVIGREKKTNSFWDLPNSCAIFVGSLRPGSPKQMSRRFNAAMRNISKSGMQNFLSTSDIDRDLDFLIADSWIFKGLWSYQFEEQHTTTCNFYTNSTSKGLMRFMYLQEYLKYGYFSEWNVEAVELPLHHGSSFSCMLMMPVKADIGVLIKSLNHRRFKDIYSKMSFSKTDVRLPQFTLRIKFSAKSILQQFGFNAAFNESVFHVFDNKNAVPLGDVIQKVKLVMDHDGEQSAKMYVDRRMGNLFIAHQPFIFVIFEKTQLVPIIVGHMVTASTPKDIGPESDEISCDRPPRYQ
nr:FXa-directed anticoagulant precursor [Aedes aegypti]